MEKTKEQKLASKERYLTQEAKAINKLQTKDLYDFIDGLRYSYSLCMRYRKNLREFIDSNCPCNPFEETDPLNECLKSGILKPWNDTYYFDKESADSLQEYIIEQNGI